MISAGFGAVPSHLVPGLGVMRAGDSGRESEPDKGGGWGVDSGLVSLHVRGRPTASFTNLRIN